MPKELQATGFFRNLPPSEPMKLLVRIYIIRCLQLHPMDSSGKSDPYIVLTLGKAKIRDKVPSLGCQWSDFSFGLFWNFGLGNLVYITLSR